jgi:hypothetical protein
MEPAGSGVTWTGSPKGGFSGRKHHKPRQSVVANTLSAFRCVAVGFIDWLDAFVDSPGERECKWHSHATDLTGASAPAIVNACRRIVENLGTGTLQDCDAGHSACMNIE